MVSGRSPGLHRSLLPLQLFAVGDNAEQATTSQHAVQVWLTLLQALLALIFLAGSLVLSLIPAEQLDLLITFVTGGRS